MAYDINERLQRANKSFQEAYSWTGKIPDREYLMQVVKVLIEESKKNNKLYLSITLRVQGPTQKGYEKRKFYDLEDEKKMWILKSDLMKFNIELPELQDLTREADRMNGQYVVVDAITKGDFQDFRIKKIHNPQDGYSEFKQVNEPAPF